MDEDGAVNPEVSVVMSVYNDETTVERAVRSVLDQTFTDLELIVIDDGSIDGTSEILARLTASDSRMSIIRQENSGLTRALIRGCNEARGHFIARQDSDDWSHPERIAEQVQLLNRDESIGFVSCATEYVGPRDEHLTVVRRPTDPVIATRGLLEERQGPPAHGSVMFRKSLYEEVGGYRAEFYFGQDSDLWLRMAENGRIAYCGDVRYKACREVHGASGAGRAVQMRFGQLGQLCREARRAGASEEPFLEEARRLALERRSDNEPMGFHRGAFADAEYVLGSQLVKNGDARALSYLWRAISARPWHARAWVRLVQALALRVGGGGGQ